MATDSLLIGDQLLLRQWQVAHVTDVHHPTWTLMQCFSTDAYMGCLRTLSASPAVAALCSFDASICGSAGGGAA